MPETLYDKLRNAHVVRSQDDGTSVLDIDRQLVHEATSPQAFEWLKLAGRRLWRSDSTVGTADDSTPTRDGDLGVRDPISRRQVDSPDGNISEFGALACFPLRGAGSEWREPSRSMCLARYDDRLEPGERYGATSDRNFDGRQGAGGRTQLVSPRIAAAAVIAGHFVDVREWS